VEYINLVGIKDSLDNVYILNYSLNFNFSLEAIEAPAKLVFEGSQFVLPF
jgi:hypothetical protein